MQGSEILKLLPASRPHVGQKALHALSGFDGLRLIVRERKFCNIMNMGQCKHAAAKIMYNLA